MDPLHQKTEMSRAKSRSDRNPTHIACLPHPTQSSSSGTTALEGERYSDRQAMQNSDPSWTTTASLSSQLLTRGLSPVFSAQNPQSGLFTGVSHVDASHGVWNDVGRDQYNINVEMKVC